ncbi:MAG: CopG family transcriptional regulator [Euzebya sp.]
MAAKTTVYLTDQQKAGVEREARRQGLSEAEVIRRAIQAAVHAPGPTAGSSAVSRSPIVRRTCWRGSASDDC